MTIKRTTGQPSGQAVEIPQSDTLKLTEIQFSAHADADTKRVMQYARNLLEKINDPSVAISVTHGKTRITMRDEVMA
jgi:hypothetical protein